MVSLSASLAIGLALVSQAPVGVPCSVPGHVHSHSHGGPGAPFTPPGPGYGWGFPNDSPDKYGWVDYGTTLPIGADRTPDYFFRRQYSMPANEMFLPTYFNPYLTRGQRYLPYSGGGGWHPAGGPALGSADLPMHPYEDSLRPTAPRTAPRFSGRVGAPPVPSGNSGLIP